MGRTAPAALAVAGLLLAAPPAAATGVSLQLQGEEQPVVVPADQIDALADVPPTTYRVSPAPGRPKLPMSLSGTRLATVLRAAGIDPASVPTLELTRDDGTILYLPRTEIDPASGPPPLVYVHGRSVVFAGAGETFASASGTPLRVTVSSTAVLSVDVSASDTEIAPRGRVAFEAEVEGALPGEQLTYEWRFGDGRTASTAEARHRFRRRGRYAVVLHVTGDQASGGSSEPVVVQVGRPEQAPGDGQAGRSQAEEAPNAGPVDGTGTGGAADDGTAPPAPAAGAEQSPGTDDRTAAERKRRRSRRAAQRDPEQAPLTGRVLGAVVPRSAAQAGRAPASAAAARAGSDGGPALGWLAGAAGCLLLLAWGANAEWRAGARRRARVLGAER
jgi:PKD domain